MIPYYKYHGAGNDFVIVDNRGKTFDRNDVDLIQTLCHRRFGVGADGILLLEDHPDYDFEMVYINSDGSIGSMCGNGGRCIVHFAHNILGIIPDVNNIRFLAVDGEHEAKILENGVKLKMQDVNEIGKRNGLTFLKSGTTPHNIQFVVNIESFPVVDEARKIKAKDDDPKGVNVNYVENKNGIFYVRTYERGVEDETLACGTGATCVAIAAHDEGLLGDLPAQAGNNFCKIKMPGGDMRIDFERTGDKSYKNIWLTGPAIYVFKGEWNEGERYIPRFF